MTTATAPRAALQFLPLQLGQVVATPEAFRTVEKVHNARTQEYLRRLISRHKAGDWGCCDEHDSAANDRDVIEGGRILSAYPIDPARPYEGDNRLWIITDADRSRTTVLLPSEY